MTTAITDKTEAGKAEAEGNRGGAAAVGAGKLGATAAQVGAAGLRVSHIVSREARVSPTEVIVEGPESTLAVKARWGCHHIASQHPRAGLTICPVATTTTTAATTGAMAHRTPKVNMAATTTGAMARMAGSMGCPRKGTAEEQSRWYIHLRSHGGGEDFEVDEEEERLVPRGNQ